MLSPGNSSIVHNHPPTICRTNNATFELWLNRTQIKSCNKTAKKLRKNCEKTAKNCEKTASATFQPKPGSCRKTAKKLRKTAEKLRVQHFYRSRPRSCRKTAKKLRKTANKLRKAAKKLRVQHFHKNCACNISSDKNVTMCRAPKVAKKLRKNCEKTAGETAKKLHNVSGKRCTTSDSSRVFRNKCETRRL